MKEFTLEQSEKAAIPIKKMNDLAQELDIEYLSSALKSMRENHLLRDSAAVLNPDPFTHNEKQDLNAAKLDQLELMLKLANNVALIKELSIKLHKAKGNVNDLNWLFGG